MVATRRVATKRVATRRVATKRVASNWAAAVGAGTAVILVPQIAGADTVKDFYKGKTITMYIGYSAGGGYDAYARILANHMGKHIPGNPTFVAKNRTGAGSMRIVNELYNVLPRDGTAIATFGRGIPNEQLFGNKAVKFDATKMNWVGSLNSEVSVCVAWHTVPVNTWEDMVGRGMIVGGVGKGSDTDAFPTVLNNVLGTKLKLVTGYPGGNDINIAMERKEVDGRCGWSWSSVVSTRPTWLKDKKIKILIQMSTQKHPDLPTVPFVLDLAKSQRDKTILNLIYGRQLWGRPLAMGPDVPADRVAAIRKAFIATTQDPAFIAEMNKRRLPFKLLDGETLQKKMGEMLSQPKDIVEAAARATNYTGNIEISKAVIPIETMSGKITSIKRGGRRVTFAGAGKTRKARVSGRNTKITIAGKEAKRKALKEGMSCKLTYQASAAREIACN